MDKIQNLINSQQRDTNITYLLAYILTNYFVSGIYAYLNIFSDFLCHFYLDIIKFNLQFLKKLYLA